VLQDKKVQAVEALVALGWDINSPGREGPIKTMLFAATKHGQWILVQWLLGESSMFGLQQLAHVSNSFA
jgi:hypothetical protein